MRKHYITAILGIIFFAAVISIQSGFHYGISTEGKAAPQQTGIKVDIGDKIISEAANAVSLAVETAMNWLVK